MKLHTYFLEKLADAFSTKASRQFEDFFSLPAEVRNMIYNLLWTSKCLKYDPTLWSARVRGDDRYPKDLQILLVCRQFHQEALAMLMTTTRIRPTDAIIQYYALQSSRAGPTDSLRNAMSMLPAVRFVSMKVADMTIKNTEAMLNAMPGLVDFELTFPFHSLNISHVQMPIGHTKAALLPSLAGIRYIQINGDDLVKAKDGNKFSNRLQAIVRAWFRRRKCFKLVILAQITCKFGNWYEYGRQSKTWSTRTNLNNETMDFVAENGDVKMRIPLPNLLASLVN